MSRAWCKTATQAADKYALLGMGGSKNAFQEKKKSDHLLKRNFDQLSVCPTYKCLKKQGKIKHSQGFQKGNIPFVENCPDVMNCDLLGHCISLGRNPCCENQDGQGGFIYQGHEGEKIWGRSSNHFQCSV